MTVLAVAITLNVKYNDWFYKAQFYPTINKQSLINKDLISKIDKLQETVDYLEFSLDVNNKLIEELLTEQIQKKGD